MRSVALSHRAVLRIGGVEAEDFLQRIVTADLSLVDATGVRPCALLSPQGKILHEFLVSRTGEGFRLDVSRAFLPDLARRLMFFRLHADVTFEPLPSAAVVAAWDTAQGLRDERFPIDVRRLYDATPDTATIGEWTALRLRHGVAELGTDYGADDLFPHDVGLVANCGVAVRKGCYVGQEVVSRMHHRGTGRRRVALIEGSDLPPPGTLLTAGGKPLGTMGGSLAGMGLAIVRMDRVTDAIAANAPVEADGIVVTVHPPAGADWSLPRATEPLAG